MACPRCVARGKTWPGSDPKCAFPDGLAFVSDNWNCATMNDLRALVAADATWNDDEWIATMPIESPGACFLVMAWYKYRGCTGQAMLLDSDGREALTLDVAERILSDAEAKKAAKVLA